MKTYFACSDIHGFYDEWMKSLADAGFDVNDPEHVLIVCGDIFDRGRQPIQVYEFITSLPRERRILIRGNHESLLRDLVDRGYDESHDRSNGTVTTLYDLAKVDVDHMRKWRTRHLTTSYIDDKSYENAMSAYIDEWNKVEKKLYHGRRITKILKWIDSDEWCDYAEIGKYIFVHSFIPLKKVYNEFGYSIPGKERYFKDWRTNSTKEMWDSAKWGCPWRLYLEGRFKEESDKGKILVCGHWHASDFWNRLDFRDDLSKFLDVNKENPIYRSEKNPNIIGLDACTVLTHVVNVLVLKEEDM